MHHDDSATVALEAAEARWQALREEAMRELRFAHAAHAEAKRAGVAMNADLWAARIEALGVWAAKMTELEQGGGE